MMNEKPDLDPNLQRFLEAEKNITSYYPSFIVASLSLNVGSYISLLSQKENTDSFVILISIGVISSMLCYLLTYIITVFTSFATACTKLFKGMKYFSYFLSGLGFLISIAAFELSFMYWINPQSVAFVDLIKIAK